MVTSASTEESEAAGHPDSREGAPRGPEDELDELVRVAGPGLQVGGIGLALLVAGLIVWAFVGTVSQTAAGQGMIVSGDGLVSVYVPANGIVTDARVRAGDQVAAGQTLFVVSGQGGSPSAVTAPTAGTVIDMKVRDGDATTLGMISTVIAPAGPLSVLAYVPLAQGKQVAPGMAVEVSPSTVPREVGYLPGRVESVAPYPVPRVEIAEHLDSELLAEQMAADGPAIALKIALTPDAGAPSGYQWSSGTGPSTKLTVGTPATIEVITASGHPVSLLTGSTGALGTAAR